MPKLSHQCLKSNICEINKQIHARYINYISSIIIIFTVFKCSVSLLHANYKAKGSHAVSIIYENVEYSHLVTAVQEKNASTLQRCAVDMVCTVLGMWLSLLLYCLPFTSKVLPFTEKKLCSVDDKLTNDPKRIIPR